MQNVCVAFDILQDGIVPPLDIQFMCCHMIFDVKIEDFYQKTPLIAGEHMTKTPATITYASTVSRENVWLALQLAVLNNVDVRAADVLNAYITAPCQEKISTTLGREFGANCNSSLSTLWAKVEGCCLQGALGRVHARDGLQVLPS